MCREPIPKRVTLPKTALVWWNSRMQLCYFSERGSSPFGFILPAQRQWFLHTSQLCEYCPGASVAETNQSDSCIFPMKLGACWDCDGILEVCPWPCAASRMPSLSPPPVEGIWLFHHHGFVVAVDRYGDDSVHGGPLTS